MGALGAVSGTSDSEIVSAGASASGSAVVCGDSVLEECESSPTCVPEGSSEEKAPLEEEVAASFQPDDSAMGGVGVNEVSGGANG